MKRNSFAIFSIILLLVVIISSCKGKTVVSPVPQDVLAHAKDLPDTLRVGTLYSPTSYFIYRGETMGYEYDMISKFAKDKNIGIRMVVANNMQQMIAMLDSGSIDVIAYEMPITAEYNKQVLHCGVRNVTYQVLVQPLVKGKPLIKDVTQLVGKDVYVEANSKYESRLQNLDNELGGGIKIHPVSQDTIISEDMIEMVSDGKMPLTIVDSDIAKLNKTYYSNIDISLNVSFPQQSSWAVSKEKKFLADSINAWVSLSQNISTSKTLLKQYFEQSKNSPNETTYNLTIKKGKISPYDEIFKRYAKRIHWDWRLLGAMAYVESQFDTTVISWAGARGIMQLMPATARRYGLNGRTVNNPEKNIEAAVASIFDINKSLSQKVPNKEERRKFILAAYNAGIGHVYDAIELAKKYGKNPEKWDGNVGEMILMKANPEYFNDEVCRFGYFKGKETTAYVIRVQKVYHLYTSKVKH